MKLPDPQQRITALQASRDGRALTVRRAGDLPGDQLVLVDGAVRWRLTDVEYGGGLARRVLLAPRGGRFLTWVKRPEATWTLHDGAREVPLPDFVGGAWSADGAWFGGPGGAWTATGERTSGPLARMDKLDPALWWARGDRLAFVDGADLYAWDGRGEPTLEEPFPLAPKRPQRRLDQPLEAPLAFSPDGARLAWADPKGGLWLGDLATGAESSLPAALAWAWVGDDLVAVDAGGAWAWRAPGKIERLARFSTSAAAPCATGIWIGGDDGALALVPLG